MGDLQEKVEGVDLILKLIIDDELSGIITEDWIRTVLAVVDPNMLTDLTIKIIEPSKDDKYQEMFDSPGFNWEDEKLREELGRRMRMGLYPGEKTVEVYMRRGAWMYYTARRTIIINLYHEIYHANDPNVNEEWKPNPVESPYWDHPREIRARNFANKTFQRIKDKRGVIMINAKIRQQHPDLFR